MAASERKVPTTTKRVNKPENIVLTDFAMDELARKVCMAIRTASLIVLSARAIFDASPLACYNKFSQRNLEIIDGVHVYV
jgi:hypothetical protein